MSFANVVPLAITEALVAAGDYAHAQNTLMQLIVGDAAEADVQRGLYAVRVARAVNESIRPFDNQRDAGVGSSAIQSTVRLVELIAQIRANERLIVEWLGSAERSGQSSVDRYIDETIQIHADPRFDIFVVDGNEVESIISGLNLRGCVRVLNWSDLRGPSSPAADEGDIQAIDLVFSRMQDLSKCPPQRVWCLWGAGVTCPSSISELLHERLRKVLINANTIAALSSSWARQFIKNLPSLVEYGRDIMALSGALDGSGAIVVGAGPSLDEHIDWIKAQVPRPIIICAYKALKALAKHEITPDFVVMLDPNQQLRHLDGVDISEVAGFVVEVSVRPEVLARVDRPILPYSAGDGTSIMFGVLGKKTPPIIPTGGSVLHAELQLARLMGCRQITLIGADFGFPRDRLYADGSGTGDVLVLSDDRRNFVRKPLDGDARVGLLVKTIANDGSDMESSLELDAYRLWAENFVKEWQSVEPVRLYNLAPKGARIEGVDFVDARVHRAAPATRDPRALTETATRLVSRSKIAGSLSEAFRRKIKKLRSLQRACAKAIELARSVPANDLSIYGSVVKQATACPEVSLLLAKELREIDDQSTRACVDAPTRLLQLVTQAKRYAEETTDLYVNVTAAVARQNLR